MIWIIVLRSPNVLVLMAWSPKSFLNGLSMTVNSLRCLQVGPWQVIRLFWLARVTPHVQIMAVLLIHATQQIWLQFLLPESLHDPPSPKAFPWSTFTLVTWQIYRATCSLVMSLQKSEKINILPCDVACSRVSSCSNENVMNTVEDRKRLYWKRSMCCFLNYKVQEHSKTLELVIQGGRTGTQEVWCNRTLHNPSPLIFLGSTSMS